MLKRLLIILLFLVLAITIGAKNYVVCVGIADYPGTNNDLTLSAQDAVTIRQLYDKNADAQTVILINDQATVKNVTYEINELFAKAIGDDVVVFFFSGHGVPGGFVCYDGLLKYDIVTSAMKKSQARHKIVYADACYAGKARDSKRRSKQVSESSVVFFLSSRTTEKSLEKRNWRNSLFTAYLERGLRGGADSNRDREITTRELFTFVSEGVAKDSHQTQHPVMWGKFDDDMLLMRWK